MLTTLYDEGEKRMDKCFDIVKMKNDSKYLKMLCEYKINPSWETKFHIYHCMKNIIDLDTIRNSEEAIVP